MWLLYSRVGLPSSKDLFVSFVLCADIQDCCATRGDGLLEGLGWVKKQLRSPKQTNRGSPQTSPGDGGEAEPKEHKERSRLQSSWLSFSNYLTRGGGANSTETYQRF